MSSMTSLVIHKMEPNIFCLWESFTPVWGNIAPLSEGVSHPRPKLISRLSKISIYILQPPPQTDHNIWLTTIKILVYLCTCHGRCNLHLIGTISVSDINCHLINTVPLVSLVTASTTATTWYYHPCLYFTTMSPGPFLHIYKLLTFHMSPTRWHNCWCSNPEPYPLAAISVYIYYYKRRHFTNDPSLWLPLFNKINDLYMYFPPSFTQQTLDTLHIYCLYHL